MERGSANQVGNSALVGCASRTSSGNDLPRCWSSPSASLATLATRDRIGRPGKGDRLPATYVKLRGHGLRLLAAALFAHRFAPHLDGVSAMHRTGVYWRVGAGSLGLGEFWPRPLVGCDVSFPSKAEKLMVPVMCSGHHLPFSDGSFDAVADSDVVEHIAPQIRSDVIAEALRVTRGWLCLGSAMVRLHLIWTNCCIRNTGSAKCSPRCG